MPEHDYDSQTNLLGMSQIDIYDSDLFAQQDINTTSADLPNGGGGNYSGGL